MDLYYKNSLIGKYFRKLLILPIMVSIILFSGVSYCSTDKKQETDGLDHRFVHNDIATSLQDLKGFEYDHRWLKHTGYTHHIPYGILEGGRNKNQGQKEKGDG